MRDVTLRQLRIVAATAKTGKIQGAATLLHVTPPAITLQLKQLEESLGLPVFERSRDGMKLTGAGELLLESAHRIEAELAACAEGLNALRGLTGGSVAIGVVSTAKYFAPAALGAFKREHPNLDLKLFVGNREETISGLASLDFDVVIMGRPPEGLAVKSAVLGNHPHVIIARPEHPLAGRRGLTPADLADEPFLMREPGSGTRSLTEMYLSQAGVKPRIAMEISSNETIKQAVMAGLGIALISAHTIGAEMEMERLAILEVAGLPAWRQWRLVRHADKRLTPAGASLWQFFEANGAAFLPSLDLVPDERAPDWTDWT
jgi:DNA-binding transcriptional LysR family regulator